MASLVGSVISWGYQVASSIMAYNVARSGYDNAVEGGASVLGLDVGRHGTNAINYVKILFTGADPSRGGSSDGATVATKYSCMLERAKGYFFITSGKVLDKKLCGVDYNFKREISGVLAWIGDCHVAKGKSICSVCVQIFNVDHQKVTTYLYNFFKRAQKEDFCRKLGSIANASLASGGDTTGLYRGEGDLRKVSVQFVSVMLMPIHRVVYEPSSMERVAVLDQDCHTLAIKTNRAISPAQFGVLGIIYTTITADSSILERIKENPEEFQQGLLQLAYAVGQIALSYALDPSGVSTVVGFLLS